MLLFGGVIENIFRPAYQRALVEGASRRAHRYLRKWALVIVLGSLTAVALALIGHRWLAHILLGEQYRSVSYLMPWIVGGYALLILSHVANRVCYANEATRSILLIESAGALLAVVFGFICIEWAGLKGAAAAISLYYGAQLIMSFRSARHWFPVARPSAVEKL
jgi:O-antigen/teichoic acid export membrane protein